LSLSPRFFVESRWIEAAAMPTTKQLTFDTVNFDDSAEADEFEGQLFAAGLARVKAESDELRRGACSTPMETSCRRNCLRT
jgi:hypothetical protein